MKSLRLTLITAAVALLSVGQPILLRTFTLSTAAILLSAPKAQAKDASEIAEMAKAITVRIEGATQGSGVLVKKEGNSYTVLTSWHVAKDNRIGEEVGIITADGKEHLWKSKSLQRLGKVDMAVITFTSKRNYQVAKIGDIKSVSMGNQIFVGGFPLPSSAIPISFLRFLDGKVIANASVSIPNGYQLLYSNPTLKGMSGGCVLDEQGNLVGIHGRAERDDQTSSSTGKNIATRTNMAVPITYYKQFVSGEKIVARTTKASTADDYLAKAEELLGEKGKENEVIRLANKALNYKESANSYFYRAYAKHDLEDYKGSIVDYTKAIELDPEYTNAYHNRAISKDDLEDYKGAIEDYTKAIELDPNDSDTYSNRGLTKGILEDHKGAIEDYTKVIELDPKNSYAYASRGEARQKLNDNIGAIYDFTRAIELDPEDAFAYASRGVAKDSLGNYFDAIYDFTRAIEIDPKNSDYYNSRCWSKYNMEKYKNALKDCDIALSINSKNEYAYDSRGDVKLSLGDKIGACSDYKSAITNGYKKREKYLSSKEGAWCRNMTN